MPLSDTKIVPAGHRFDIDIAMSDLLSLRVRGGALLNGYGYTNVPNTTLTLTASATNYVEMDDNGVVTTNTTGFTAGYTQLYIVTTGATNVTGIQDCRALSATTQQFDGVQATNLAASNVVGVFDLIYRFDLAAGANADTDIVSTHKIRVIDAWTVLRGAGVASCVLTVKNSATAICGTMAASGSDQALVRTATIDDASWEISAGGTLRVTSSGGASQPAATVFVRAVRVA